MFLRGNCNGKGLSATARLTTSGAPGTGHSEGQRLLPTHLQHEDRLGTRPAELLPEFRDRQPRAARGARSWRSRAGATSLVFPGSLRFHCGQPASGGRLGRVGEAERREGSRRPETTPGRQLFVLPRRPGRQYHPDPLRPGDQPGPIKLVRLYEASCLVVFWLLVDRTEERVVHAPSQDDRNQRVPDVVYRCIRVFFDLGLHGFFSQDDGDGTEKHQARLQKGPHPFHGHSLLEYDPLLSERSAIIQKHSWIRQAEIASRCRPWIA